MDGGDNSLGSTRTRDVSRANRVLLFPLAFIRCPVVEMTAERASVVSATRIVGSGPANGVRVGAVMTGVEAAGAGHAGCVRRGLVFSPGCCWAIAMGRQSECASSKDITLRIVRIVLQNQSTDYADFANHADCVVETTTVACAPSGTTEPSSVAPDHRAGMALSSKSDPALPRSVLLCEICGSGSQLCGIDGSPPSRKWSGSGFLVCPDK